MFFFRSHTDFENKPKTLPHLQAMHSCGEKGRPSSLQREETTSAPEARPFQETLGSGAPPDHRAAHFTPALPPGMLRTLPLWVLLPGRGCQQPHLHSPLLSPSLSVLCKDTRNFLLTVDSKARVHCAGSPGFPLPAPCSVFTLYAFLLLDSWRLSFGPCSVCTCLRPPGP